MDIEKLKKRCGYDGKPQQFKYGFDLACRELAKAQAAPEWISTEDKEPVENGNYLVCIDGDVFYLTAKWVKNHFKFLARGYGLTEDFTDWRYCEGVKVTHWMLLPDSPKAQEPAVPETQQSKQAEIDDLKAQLKAVHDSRIEFVEYCRKMESGDFVLVSKNQKGWK